MKASGSLAGRLIIAASLWSAAAMVIAALILTLLYRQSVERSFDERLGVYHQLLIGAFANQHTPDLANPGNFGEARFDQILSGWYWQVRDAATGATLLNSPSLFTDRLDPGKASRSRVRGGVLAGAIAGPLDQSLRFREVSVTFADGRRANVLAAGDAGELDGQTREFATSVALTLGVFGIGLVLATFVQIRWGLRPLDRVRQALADLRSGREVRFEGPFPSEIAPLAKELNAVLESNQKVIERARTQVGNLAHALKTPLSVVLNEGRAGAKGDAHKIVEQAELMRRQIDHYLDRARIAAQSDVIGASTEVTPAIERLVRVMVRLNQDRGVAIRHEVARNLRFKGEQQDFEEIIGNLVDNACKWAKSEVRIAAAPGQASDGAPTLVVTIDDDGPGLTAEQREQVTVRGRRLDESKPGSGLGLSIVTDLVGLYDGEFRLGEAPGGGLRAEIILPAAS